MGRPGRRSIGGPGLLVSTGRRKKRSSLMPDDAHARAGFDSRPAPPPVEICICGDPRRMRPETRAALIDVANAAAAAFLPGAEEPTP